MSTKASAIRLDAIMLGVRDIDRAKKFYAEGLGATVEQDHPGFVRIGIGDGCSALALYEWDAAAADAGVAPEGSGFRGVSLHFNPDSREAVDNVMTRVESAGGRVVRTAAEAQWGGYFGYFADPDGYLWKVATRA